MSRTRVRFFTMAGLCAGLFSIFVGVAAAGPTRLSPDAPRTPAVELAAVFSGSSVTANSDILAADITPTAPTSVLRVTVALTTASVLNVTMSDGTQTKTLGLNSSTALQAGDLYFFTFGVRNDYTYNFQPETTTEVPCLLVDEVVEEVN